MSLMKDRYFIDTNIIIYMFDKDHPDKREIAVKIVKEALESNFGCISYQVIQEFCNVALKNLKYLCLQGTADTLYKSSLFQCVQSFQEQNFTFLLSR